MNVQDVATRVKRKFGDESAVQITDDDIIRWVNDAQLEIVSSNEDLLQDTSTSNLVLGQQDYALPATLLSLLSVSIKPSGFASYGQIKSLSLQQFNEFINGWDGTFYGTGLPYVYAVYDNLIKLFPIPDANSTAGIKFYFNKEPTTITVIGDSLELPKQYHNAIVAYCMKQAYEMDENLEAATAQGADFSSTVATKRFNDQRKAQETYPVITVLEDDSW